MKTISRFLSFVFSVALLASLLITSPLAHAQKSKTNTTLPKTRIALPKFSVLGFTFNAPFTQFNKCKISVFALANGNSATCYTTEPVTNKRNYPPIFEQIDNLLMLYYATQDVDENERDPLISEDAIPWIGLDNKQRVVYLQTKIRGPKKQKEIMALLRKHFGAPKRTVLITEEKTPDELKIDQVDWERVTKAALTEDSKIIYWQTKRAWVKYFPRIKGEEGFLIIGLTRIQPSKKAISVSNKQTDFKTN